MSALKKGTGDVTHHGDNKQNERGSGVTNHPLKKSTVNPVQPNVAEGKAHAASAPKIAPQATEKKGGSEGRHTVIQTEKKPAGRDAAIGKSTFQAPRKDGGNDPLERGFTKPGKM